MKTVTAGIDIGGTNTVIGLVDREGNVCERTSITTNDYPTIESFAQALSQEINTLLSAGEYQLKGIGCGAPDANIHDGCIHNATNLRWKGVLPFVEIMKKYIDSPVILTNDANAAAMGEMMFGGAKGMTDFIVLTLGTGVGSGIVIDGQVLYGHTGFAGELGQMIVEPNGRTIDGTERKGTLEAYSSATGIVLTMKQWLEEGKQGNHPASLSPDKLSAKDIASAASKGNALALEAFDYTAKMLALGIVNSILFSSPQAIFLFGGLAKAGELLLTPLRKYVDELNVSYFKDTVQIIPSDIPEGSAAILGAAALAWK